ncbi:hypothetical protein ACFSPU_00375 [Haoranjiania flava]|uniref:Uncharacterized protein n=1 Tax=Haoranjiania flava TaxID=1856322 RepID=A0AAE3INF5_9BACT|nr:hypothetical protein [Haoranjiania flava]MCU7694221.1 hypothetical protein [Haoranjiania flava]
MKLTSFALALLFFTAIAGCDNKEIDKSGFYFELKKNGSWVNYSRGLVATEAYYPSTSSRSGGFFCFNRDSTEEFSIQIDATQIRYGSDSLAIKPYTKFDVRGMYYAKNGVWIISCGAGETKGRACSIDEMKLLRKLQRL